MAFGLVGRVLVTVAFVSLTSLAPAMAAQAAAAPARLTHTLSDAGTASQGSASIVSIPAAADAYSTPEAPDSNFGSVKWLAVDGTPTAEAYVAFNTSAYVGHKIRAATLSVYARDGAAAGVSVYRISKQWTEDTITWNNRPAPGTLLAATEERTAAGVIDFDLSSVFPTGTVTAKSLVLRVATTAADGLLISAREGSSAPTLALTLGGGAVNAPPTPKPTPTPSDTPDASIFQFTGNGTDHGVGMSQYGARGRALDGQDYQQILAHYYQGTKLGTIDAATNVRVLLAAAHVPTRSSPARITSRGGGWSSSAFQNGKGRALLFPPDSYVQLVNGSHGWEADAYAADGTLVATTQTQDLVIKPADATTLLEMTWRVSLTRYTLYRGSMRLTASGKVVQAVNTVRMDDYIKGVVPAEIPALWPVESVKAQAVAARGYAYVRLRPDRAYDVVPTASNQVYGGASAENPRSNAAVDATANQVVTYLGKVADTFFFTVGGGYTEDNEYAWVGNNGKVVAKPIPYLRGEPDYDRNGIAYDANAPNYSWASGKFSWQQLGAMLGRDPRTRVGTLLKIKFDRGVSGRVYRVTLVGSARTVYVSGALFKGVFNAQRRSGPALQSTLFYLKSR